VWFIVIAAVLLLGVAVMEQTGKRPAMPYGAFLDQVEAGNVASVTFHGMEISGQFKHPLDNPPSGGAAQRDSFRSCVPYFGDPTLIPELRKQHVAIDVTSPSAWSWLLGHVPWPMLIFVGAILVAGFVRLMRGEKAQSGAVEPMMPMHGMMGLVSRLFAKKDQAASTPTHNSEEPKNR
jgi:ATP-dependent Zn protease